MANKAHGKESQDKALALFLQGLKWEDISKGSGVPYGTIRKWADNGNWKEIRAGTKQKLEQMGKPMLGTAVANDLAAQSRALRESLACELTDEVGVLRQQPAKNVSEVLKRSKAVKTIAEAGSIVHGWGQDRGNIMVNIALLSQTESMPAEITEAEFTKIADHRAIVGQPANQ